VCVCVTLTRVKHEELSKETGLERPVDLPNT
jgi:hypothetical protein